MKARSVTRAQVLLSHAVWLAAYLCIVAVLLAPKGTFVPDEDGRLTAAP